jgi:hypothetical protein
MKWLDKILNRRDESNIYRNFQSLMKIEALPPNQRSSSVLHAKKDLLLLKKDDAINWLANNISSPVSRDWGRLLVTVSADWACLKSWMKISKLHALAAADAIDCYIYNHEILPEGSSPSEVLAELEELVSEHQNLRLKEILDSVSSFVTPSPMPKNLAEASEILFGEAEINIVIKGKDTFAKWHSLFHKAHNKYCLCVLDWKGVVGELEEALSSLPIVINSETNQQSDLIFETIDVGSDETILICLPTDKMNKLKKLAPSSIKFHSSAIRPNPSLELVGRNN